MDSSAINNRRTADPSVVTIGSFVTRYLTEPTSAASYTLVEHTLGAGMIGEPA
ncbi:MAG TPA: hypothetical protein VJ852_07755 [Gemmatimonadaceae bacterium]|nr:hypothetical protein [Gemmatimonadaceae bacterium]